MSYWLTETVCVIFKEISMLTGQKCLHHFLSCHMQYYYCYGSSHMQQHAYFYTTLPLNVHCALIAAIMYLY